MQGDEKRKLTVKEKNTASGTSLMTSPSLSFKDNCPDYYSFPISVWYIGGRMKWPHTTCTRMHTKKTPGLHLLFTVHCVNTGPSEAASQQQDVVVRHVLAQQHPLPMSLINSTAVSLSSCPSNRGTHTHTHTSTHSSSTASPSAIVTYNQSELLCIMLPMLS